VPVIGWRLLVIMIFLISETVIVRLHIKLAVQIVISIDFDHRNSPCVCVCVGCVRCDSYFIYYRLKVNRYMRLFY